MILAGHLKAEKQSLHSQLAMIDLSPNRYSTSQATTHYVSKVSDLMNEEILFSVSAGIDRSLLFPCL